MLQKTYSSHHHHPHPSRPSTATSSSCASVSPSTSLRTINGKAPLRSALRSRTSNSTITNGGEPSSSPSPSSGPESQMLAVQQQHQPPLPPSTSGASLRQAYFDKYPRRGNSPSAARERVEEYRNGVPQMSFPSIDDPDDMRDDESGRTTTTNSSADEREPPSSSSSSSPRPPRAQRPAPKKKVYTHRSHSTEYTLNSPTASQISTVPMPLARPPEIRTSLSSSYTQTSLNTPKSSIHRSDGVLVAVPAPTAGVGVETMDALVQGMNGGEDHLESITKMFGRRRAADHKKHFGVVPGSMHHPLYHPPVPPLPGGQRMEREDSGTSGSMGTEEEDGRTADELKFSRKGSSGSVTPAPTPQDLPRRGSASALSSKSSKRHVKHKSRESNPHVQTPTPRERERKVSDVRPTAMSIDEIIRKNMPAQSPVVVPSINDIIRAHAPPRLSPAQTQGRPSPVQSGRPSPVQGGRPSPVQGRSPGQQNFPPSAFGRRIEDVEEEEEEATGRSSIDSITAEVRNTLRQASLGNGQPSTTPVRISEEGRRSVSSYQASSRKVQPVKVSRNLHHAKSFGDKPRSSTPSEPFPVHLQPESEHGHGYGNLSQRRPALPPLFPPRPHTSASASGTSPSSPISVGTTIGTVAGSGGDPTKLELAQFLRSPRLTRLMTLRRPPHSGLTVSLADVGSPTGHPVIVYLGLGCVRYLIALYDEMAEALNLRLVCVDRWGLGRTGEPKNSQGRGLLEWAAVIEEVADTLGLATYSVVAHSAGAPYALAGVLKCGERRVQGSVHLLAPWVSMSVDTGYKWLKYVPNGIIKTAQAAEWKVQGWRLGKPPTISYPAVGYDATAPLSSQHLPQNEDESDDLLPPSHPAVRSSLSISDYDDLADFDGQFGSTSTLGQTVDKNSNGKRKGKKPAKAILSIFPGKPGSVGRTSRANSIVSTTGARTLPAKSPKLKGLKSLSSLRHEATGASMLSLDSWAPARGVSEPATPNVETPLIPETALPPPSQLGLGLGLDEEMMQWGARLKMLEEISPPTPPSSVLNGSNRGGTQPSRSSGDGRSRRSISLTGGRPDFAKDIPPVPQLVMTPNGSRTPRKTPMSLTNALLRASHAESLKGGTADLLAILERDSNPWGFSYADVKQPVKVWYGDRDEKIAISSVHWMERVMKDCTVNIVKGGTHNLMTNAEVVVEVLESVAREAAAMEMTSSPSSASAYRRKFRT